MSWHDDLIDSVDRLNRRVAAIGRLLEGLIAEIEAGAALCRCGHLALVHDESGKGACRATAVGGVCPCRIFQPANP